MRPRVGTNCRRRIDATFGNTMRTRVGAVRCRRRNATTDATASAAKELDRKFCCSRSRLRSACARVRHAAPHQRVSRRNGVARGCGGRRRRGRGGYPPLAAAATRRVRLATLLTLQQPRSSSRARTPTERACAAHAHQPAAAATRRRGSQPARETRSLGAAARPAGARRAKADAAPRRTDPPCRVARRAAEHRTHAQPPHGGGGAIAGPSGAQHDRAGAQMRTLLRDRTMRGALTAVARMDGAQRAALERSIVGGAVAGAVVVNVAGGVARSVAGSVAVASPRAGASPDSGAALEGRIALVRERRPTRTRRRTARTLSSSFSSERMAWDGTGGKVHRSILSKRTLLVR